ncbi:MAG: hypothetical protein HEP71_34430 [Roseivirga sp.]|nr:hypothetical protein [Roseivirga sp.]
METYDLLYIGLSGLVIFILIREAIRLFRYKTEEKSIEGGSDKTNFLFFSYSWVDNIIRNILILWILWRQPLDNGQVYPLLLMVVFASYTVLIIIKWPSEVMTIGTDSLEFRLGKSRSLSDIKAVTIEQDRLVIYAKNHPKKTKLIKSRFKGDWELLESSIINFVSQNPEIEIKGTAPGPVKAEV